LINKAFLKKVSLLMQSQAVKTEVLYYQKNIEVFERAQEEAYNVNTYLLLLIKYSSNSSESTEVDKILELIRNYTVALQPLGKLSYYYITLCLNVCMKGTCI
jgi:hypothetical protein